MSPVEIVYARIERQRLARLRKAVGLTGYELTDDGRPGAAPGLVIVAVLVCAAAIAAVGLGLAGCGNSSDCEPESLGTRVVRFDSNGPADLSR